MITFFSKLLNYLWICWDAGTASYRHAASEEGGQIVKGKAFTHTEMNSQDGGCVVLDLMPPDRSPVSVTSSIVPSTAPVTRWRHQQWKGW